MPTFTATCRIETKKRGLFLFCIFIFVFVLSFTVLLSSSGCRTAAGDCDIALPIVEGSQWKVVQSTMDIRVVSSRNATALGDEVVGTAYIQGGKRHGPYENPSGVIFDAVVLHTVASQDNCTFFFFEGILPLDGSEFAASCARLDQPPEALTLRFEEDPSAPGEAVLGKSGRLVGEYRRDWEEPGVPSEVYEVEIHSFLPFYSPCVEGGGYPPLDAGVDP